MVLWVPNNDGPGCFGCSIQCICCCCVVELQRMASAGERAATAGSSKVCKPTTLDGTRTGSQPGQQRMTCDGADGPLLIIFQQ
jgi:hypothetical protein